MHDLSLSEQVALAVMALYGLACLVGGIMGYVKAGSVPSLVTGVPSGIILLLCALAMFWQPAVALVVALIVAVLVGGFFTSNLIKHRHELRNWSGARRTALMAVGGLLVLLTSAIALATR